MGWGWREFGLQALFAKGEEDYIEWHTLLTNPTIAADILEALYRKSEYFAEVDEKTWLGMVQVSVGNERLIRDKESDWEPHPLPEPDWSLWGINQAIFNFLEVAPVRREQRQHREVDFTLCQLAST